MGVEKMSGIYIPGAKIPDGDYVRVLMLHKDGTCVDGIGNVFNIVPVPEPHGRLIDADAIPYKKIMYDDDDFYYGVTKPYIDRIPTVIPASESKERHAFLPQYELTPPSEEG